MSRTNLFIQEVLDLFYLNANITDIGDAAGIRGSAAPGNLYVALMIDGVEAAYTGYSRVAIPRSAAGFSRAESVVTNVAQLNFPLSQGAGVTTNNAIAIYDKAVGGKQKHYQLLGYNITSTINHQPIIPAGQLAITGVA